MRGLHLAALNAWRREMGRGDPQKSNERFAGRSVIGPQFSSVPLRAERHDATTRRRDKFSPREIGVL
jgi:hypothetical protein